MSRTPNDVKPNGRVRHGKRTHRRKRKNRLPVLIIMLLIVIVALIGAVGAVISHFTPTKEKADLEALYGAGDGYAAIIENHAWSELTALWVDDHAYLDMTNINDELDSRFFWDEANQQLLYTMPEETVTITSDMANDGAPVFIVQGGTAYVQLDYVAQYTNILVQTFTDPARVVLQTEFTEVQTASVSGSAAVRVRGGIKSPVITELADGDTVTVLETLDNWTQVQTPDGWIGYVSNKSLTDTQTVTEEAPDNEPSYSSLTVDHEVCLVWQQTLSNSAYDQLQTLIASDAMESVNTVSPTWFSITASDGTYTGRAGSSYVALAHENGLDVWPVLENVNEPDVDMTVLLMSTAARSTLVQGVMSDLENSGADGLNIDLENIPTEAAEGYIQLIREFSVECRKQGLVLSVDDNVPSAWSGYYNRKEQGIVADYVIVMAYDEHYAGSDTAGSTASLDFVQQAITDTCAEVPEEKVICGIPFYSRLWKEELTSLTSEAVSMDAMQNFLTKYSAEPTWDDSVGQNYVCVESGDTTYKMWIEDAKSCDARLALISGYDLAGIACWKQGMQSSDIWAVLAKYY